MHHLYPLSKGDPLCPLGFHPQVRWPTRCKRCFRDYKEHGGRKRDEDSYLRRDESTASSPNLNSWGSLRSSEDHRRSWSSSSNLAPERENRNSLKPNSNDFNSPVSWPSSPNLTNLEDDIQAKDVPTVSLTLPKRKQLPIDRAHRTVSDSFSMSTREKSPVFNKSDSLATRAKKLQAMKEGTQDKSRKIVQVKELKASVDENTNHDVQFLIQVKSKPKQEKIVTDGTESEDDTISVAGTETTDTTLVGDHHDNELQEQIESLRQDLETMKSKCDRLEREKSDLLLRRIASMETTTSKTTATEVLKLQHRCNDLQSQLEDVKDDKKSLALKVKELEDELESRPTAQSAQKVADELRSKLLAAETLCEELMDENEDMKKELRDLEEEMEELQDNFREDQANEYTSLKKELEQTTKNCRILSFKLRKTERKTEQLEVEKGETEKKLREVVGGLNNLEKIKNMEQELKMAQETSIRLQKELDEANSKLSKFEEANSKTKTPMLGNIPKVPSTEGKVSRESLTRGGSQDDPAQLLRDLHDSLEREADLREQLKFAEEEAQNLRKKASRIEDDNESLVLQLKKMATKAKSRKVSPNRLTPEPPNEKNEGISEDDPTELKLLLELNEQEASVLRKKVEELEAEKETQKRKIKDLQDKLATKTTKKSLLSAVKGNGAQEQKIKDLEDEANDLRKKLTEKEKDAERLQAELNLTQKRAKGMQKTKSLDLDQQTLDLKRQLQLVEQEALVLRTKVQSLENENEKLSSDNKRLQLIRGTKTVKGDKLGEKYIDKIAELEVELEYANKKIKELETKSEKAVPDSKIKTSEKGDADKIKLQLSKVENERDKLADTLKKLKEGAAKAFKDRSPKRPSDFTSKVQLKNMVNDLENEIGEMMVVLNNHENSKSKLEDELKQLKSNTINNDLEVNKKELEEMKKKIAAMEIELQDEKLQNIKGKDKYDNINDTLVKTKESMSKHIEEKKQLQNELTSMKDKYQNATKEKEKFESQINKLKQEIKSSTAKQDELSTYKQQTEDLKTELDKKEKEYNRIKKELEEKEKLTKELNAKVKKLGELEKQLQDSEDKIKKNEKQSKEQLKQLSAKLEEEKDRSRMKDSEQSELSLQWSADRKVFDLQIDELNSKIKSLENIITSKNTLIEQLEESVRKEREAVSTVSVNVNNKEINNLKDELNKNKANLSEVESKLETANKSKKTAEEKLKKLENDFKKEKIALEKKSAELDIDLQNERKKIEVMKTNHEKEQKNREMELGSLRNKIKTLELGTGTTSKKASEVKVEYQERIDKLEAMLASEKREYEDLTAKYEILEEEHVVTKAKLVMEKETITSQLLSSKRELETVEAELDTLKESHASQNEKLLKEKTQLQEKVKSLEKSIQKSSDAFALDKNRIKTSLEEKLSELEQIKKEYEVVHDQMEYMRRENDDLKKKLDDYDKVSKIQRNISADSSAMEKEIKQLRIKLTNTEKQRKSDLAECKMRYDSQAGVINDELHSLQGQVTRFKRERDTYKHMLEGAQKTIGDLKSNPATRRESRASTASFDEMDESRSKIATLEQQISCMEDELSEARLEASKLKTELVSERSSWEIKISELHSRVNELEEERILSSGRTKIPGLKTRMELAWHKEREEQQRLLQETSTLARDLRQTLFEVERERDKERLESKRKQEQLKKTSEEDQEENRRKLTELQCDLLELRDAHAKLRTTNEKLRREKERHEKEREEMKAAIVGKKRAEQEDDRRINALLEQVETLIKLTPDISSSRDVTTDSAEPYTPTPPRRTKGPKSRESSPGLEKKEFYKESSLPREDRKAQIQSVMMQLTDVTEELRRYQRLSEENRERERLKRTMGMRRATSSEHDNIPDTNQISKGIIKNGNTATSLHRRSLSLEHTIQEQSIWRNDDDSMSSLQSLGSDVDIIRNRRDTSLDSRLSAGSTQSETGGTEKKKKGLMGKLKKLTKSRSIDDQDPGHFSPTRTLSSKPSSNSDINDDNRGSKKDLRERITGIFKRSGSSSRSNSLERRIDKHDTSSTQRPLMPNGSNSSITRTSPGPERITKVSNKPAKHK
ncbi:hypothetical protein ILUMI_21174 [Ignelater luminosus]|uniref:Uncharacterized protein n=1 Tax=Ignelater luminosus TaxID=2038154 RepID=A0A8K0FY75_IGNLU|nr:hypothetical protein ILUMI_21174 [Ignelater luminosus]